MAGPSLGAHLDPACPPLRHAGRHVLPCGRPEQTHGQEHIRRRPRRTPSPPRVLLLARTPRRSRPRTRPHPPCPRLRGPLLTKGGRQPGAGTASDQSDDEGRARAHSQGYRRFPLRPRLRKNAVQTAAIGHRRPSRRAAPPLPPARRKAHASRTAQGRLRHGHPRRRDQRPHSNRPPDVAVEVRRNPFTPPFGPRIPPDRRPGGQGRVRHGGRRRRPSPRVRDRERESPGKSRRGPQETQETRSKESPRRRGAVGREDARAPSERDAGEAGLADARQPRHDPQPSATPRGFGGRRRPSADGQPRAQNRVEPPDQKGGRNLRNAPFGGGPRPPRRPMAGCPPRRIRGGFRPRGSERLRPQLAFGPLRARGPRPARTRVPRLSTSSRW